jgi:hypothetical protein
MPNTSTLPGGKGSFPNVWLANTNVCCVTKSENSIHHGQNPFFSQERGVNVFQ